MRRNDTRLAKMAAGLLLAACAFGCGAATPTAPLAPEQDSQVSVTRYGNQSLGGTVVLTLRNAGDAEAIASEYNATVTSVMTVHGWQCSQVVSTTGESALSLAARLSLDPRVMLAEREEAIEPAESRQQSFAFDDGLGSPEAVLDQPSLETIGLDVAHTITRGGGVRVAVLDTGVESTHPLLAGRVVGAYDFIDGDVNPAETGNGLDDDGDGRVDEAIGHGTHVAGVIATVAPEAQLLIARVLDADGRGDLATVTAGIRWAVMNGARVLNLSLGALESSEFMQYVLEEAEHAGIIVVAAAGNWGLEDPEEYPAQSSHALGIAAVDTDGRPASFSSYGGHIDLSAPGVDVRSSFTGGGYALWSGTSMAAPFVSGTAALLLSRHPAWRQNDVLDRLEDTARPIVAGSSQQASDFGAGIIDAGAALLADAPTPGAGDISGPLKKASPGR